jgi:tetratricopeptide (TPR) repeat protein
MPAFAEPLFPPRGERGYDAAAVETFPWPVMAGYDDVHRWMDEGHAVHAAWQLRDVWEGLLKFLATLTVADHLAAVPTDDPRTKKLLGQLLKKEGLSNGTWATLMEIALKDGPPPGGQLPQLGPLLFQGGKPQRLYRLFMGDRADAVREDFIEWRNRCFGHGVFRKDLRSYAREALHWLDRLHEAFDLCRLVLQSLALESDGPGGEILTWGDKSPLPFYHGHEPAAAGALLRPVRVRPAGSDALLLTPLLSVQPCVVCGQWAAFYLDKYDRDKHRALFLDFIEGHSNEHKDLEPLRSWAERTAGGQVPAAEATAADAGEPREPDPERFRDFQHEFEPPAYLARRVAEFLQTHDRGVLVLTGPGGVGKSWATQGLDHAGMLPAALGRAVALLHVSMHGPTAPRASDVQTALAEQARQVKRWEVPAWPDGPDAHTRLAAWLAALMRANGLGELVVALDGLDDLPAHSDVPDLWPPAGALPPGCYLVLSARPGVRAAAESGLRRVRSVLEHCRELRVGPEEPEHRAVLSSYAAKRLARPRPDGQGALPAAWVEPLIDQAGGSFLYVFHYCRALHFGVYGDLAQLPAPAAYYPAFFEHLCSRVGEHLFKGYYARALALIAVAREPVGVTHLEAWGLKRSDLILILDDLADLLRSHREPWGKETLYSLGHDAVRQFLTEDADWKPRLARANHELAKLAVRRFGKDWRALDAFDVVERYLLLHLLDHATGRELDRLLADTALAQAYDHHGSALWDKKVLGPCHSAYDMALRLRVHQVKREGRPDLQDELATAYMHRGNALDHLGWPEQAVTDYNNAISLHEELVRRESRGDLRDQVATGYMNRGNALTHLGRLEAAMADYNACVRLCEGVVDGNSPHLPRDYLANALVNRGNALSKLGRLDEALVDYAACTELYADLVGCEGRADLRDEFAIAHLNWGQGLEKQHRLEDALEHYAKCVALYNELVTREDRHEFRDHLALAHNSRASALRDLGRLDEALADCGASIHLLEELVDHHGRRELRKDLAMAYGNRGNALTQLGRCEHALADYNGAVALREQLVEHEGHRELRNDLAASYMNRGNALAKLGRLEEALRDSARTVRLREGLVRGEGHLHLRNPLASAYLMRGICLARLGRLTQALADHTAAIAVREELVHGETRRELRGDLARAYLNRGVTLSQLGRLDEALADYGAGIGLHEDLVYREGQRELRNELAGAYLERSKTLLNRGHSEAALREATLSVYLREELVHGEGQRALGAGLAEAHLSRGNALGALGRAEEALRDFHASVCLYVELVCSEGRRELRDELAEAYEKRGDAFASLQRSAQALGDYGAAIDLLRELVGHEGRRELIGDLGRAQAAQARLVLRMGAPADAKERAREAVALLRPEVARTGRADLRNALTLAEELIRSAAAHPSEAHA